jgi:hypothetical protein
VQGVPNFLLIGILIFSEERNAGGYNKIQEDIIRDSGGYNKGFRRI